MADSIEIREQEFRDGLHWCSRCEQYLPLDCFNRCRKARFGLKTWCKNCRKEYRTNNRDRISEQHRRHYENNKEQVQERNRQWRRENKEYLAAYMRERHARLKAEAVALLGGCCQRCGYAEFNSGLSFHHVNPDEKDYTPTSIIASGDIEAMREELDKCVLLCRNCHQAWHGSDWEAEWTKRVGVGWTIKLVS